MRSLYTVYYDFGQSVHFCFCLITHLTEINKHDPGQVPNKSTGNFGSSKIPDRLWTHPTPIQWVTELESSWNVMAYGDATEGKWRGNSRMEWVGSTLHTTSEHGVSSITTITTADAHTSAASSRLNWRPRRFKWTRPFRRKTKSGICACAITFQTQSTILGDKEASALSWPFASV